MIEGFIYIFSNSSIPNKLKIGMTSRTPSERVKEVSSPSGVPTPFTVEYSIETSDPKKAESNIHDRLAKSRSSPNREFFAIPLNIAIQIVNEEIAKLLKVEIDYLSNSIESKVATLRIQLNSEIEKKKIYLNKLSKNSSNNPESDPEEGISKSEKFKSRSNLSRIEKIYKHSIYLLNNASYDRAVEQLRIIAAMGSIKAKFILNTLDDATNYSIPELSSDELFEVGVDLRKRHFIKQSAGMGNLKAKAFLNESNK